MKFSHVYAQNSSRFYNEHLQYMESISILWMNGSILCISPSKTDDNLSIVCRSLIRHTIRCFCLSTNAKRRTNSHTFTLTGPEKTRMVRYILVHMMCVSECMLWVIFNANHTLKTTTAKRQIPYHLFFSVKWLFHLCNIHVVNI